MLFHLKRILSASFLLGPVHTSRTHLFNPGSQVLDEELAEIMQRLQLPRLEEKLEKAM